MAYKILFFLNEVLSLKDLGEYLSEIRQNNGVGIEEVAEDLNLSSNIIKNIEIGNTRAFRDMLELRDTVKIYAKYLGLDPDKIVDEFNDFLFEHTSKISLQDILDAEKESNETNKKEIYSPYTHSKIRQIDIRYLKLVAIIFGGILFLICLFLILNSILTVDNNVNTELLNYFEVKEVN